MSGPMQEPIWLRDRLWLVWCIIFRCRGGADASHYQWKAVERTRKRRFS